MVLFDIGNQVVAVLGNGAKREVFMRTGCIYCRKAQQQNDQWPETFQGAGCLFLHGRSWFGHGYGHHCVLLSCYAISAASAFYSRNCIAPNSNPVRMCTILRALNRPSQVVVIKYQSM